MQKLYFIILILFLFFCILFIYFLGNFLNKDNNSVILDSKNNLTLDDRNDFNVNKNIQQNKNLSNFNFSTDSLENSSYLDNDSKNDNFKQDKFSEDKLLKFNELKFLIKFKDGEDYEFELKYPELLYGKPEMMANYCYHEDFLNVCPKIENLKWIDLYNYYLFDKKLL